MNQLYGNALVGQSGGPTAAINASLCGVIEASLVAHDAGLIGTLYGMRNGLDGLFSEDFVDLLAHFSDPPSRELLKRTPAAVLGSCRRKLPAVENGSDVYEEALRIFRKYNIRYFFYIGGNDSMDAVAKLSRYMEGQSYEMRVVGVPKTIDNDLPETDHTPGFGSAAKYIATTVHEILRDCSVYRIPAVTLVEVMGRDAGWLTTASALPAVIGAPGPDLIYLPERPFSMEQFYSDLKNAFVRHPNVVVAVSEGIRFADGGYVGAGAQSGVTDVFGHRYLGGTGKVLESAVKNTFGCKVRSVELNLPQRCAAHLLSCTDIRESRAVGAYCVKAALHGESGCMGVILRKPGSAYHVRYATVPIRCVANRVRHVPDTYINAAGNGITDACIGYLQPLIRGEVRPVFRNGLPMHYIL